MAIINYISKAFDLFFGTAWFLNLFHLITLFSQMPIENPLGNANFISSAGFGFVGVVWGCVKIYNLWHDGKIEREQKRENLRRYKHETDIMIAKENKNKVRKYSS